VGIREIPASEGQRLLWFLDRYRGENGALNCPVTCRVKGRLDYSALQAALDVLTARHESLRTSFVGGGRRLTQRIHPPGPASLAHVSLARTGDPEVTASAALEAELRSRIDPAQWPVRTTLWRLADDDHVLCVNMHHLVTDTWSCNVLFRELATAYDRCCAGGAELPPLGWQYAQFALWQQRRRKTDDFRRHLEYWLRQLDGVQAPSLPLARIADGSPGTDEPRRSEYFEIDEGASAALRELAHRSGTTIFGVMLAIYFVLLHLQTGERDLAVGSVFANRARAEVQNTVGFLANLLVLRTAVPPGATFAELVQATHETVTGAFAHQELAFHLLPQVTARKATRLDDLVFQMLADPLDSMARAAGTEFRNVAPHLVGRFEFEFALMPRGRGFAGKLYYTESRVDRDWALSFIGAYAALATTVAVDPGVRVDEMRLPA
jgi:Condensation domain